MKIASINVNNFGGTISRPLRGNDDLDSWKDKIIFWRKENEDTIQKNVERIVAFASDYDVIFLHEVDTNCASWKKLNELMEDKYKLEVPNDCDKYYYFKNGFSSISCVYIKNEIKYEYEKYNFSGYAKNVEIKLLETNLTLIGVHTNYEDIYWEKLIDRWEQLKQGDVLLIGDLNVFDSGTERRNYFDKVLKQGAIDLWLNQGEDNNTPTYNTNRIDYALSSKSLLEKKPTEQIIDSIRKEKVTDHAAICVIINDSV